jgi:hypothetical protein
MAMADVSGSSSDWGAASKISSIGSGSTAEDSNFQVVAMEEKA